MSKPIDRRVAIVTGSTKGIGRAIAIALAARGDAVVVTGRQQDHAREVAAEIEYCGNSALGLGFDIEDKAQLDRLLAETIEHYGRLDILINNAVSQSCLLPSNDIDDDQTLQIINSNLSHTYLLCRKAFPHLKAQRGCILNIGSIVIRRHLLGLPLYSLIKGSIINLTQILASEWASSGVRVNAVNPGFIRTNAFSDMGMPPELVEESYRFYSEYQPLGGVGSPADIAHTVAYLTSVQAAFVTGTVVDIDGGYSTKGLALYS